ncbi:hypothetical protein V3C99_001548 [Haemonchus contortus]
MDQQFRQLEQSQQYQQQEQQQPQEPQLEQQQQQTTTVKPISAPLTIADFIDDEHNLEIPTIQSNRKSNTLPCWGNQQTMNLNGLVLENVKESYYYKNHLVEIDTAQQLLDEVFYKVKHLEPWEKGTRKVQGMTGMCGGVRGVGAGGVVSSAFCLLYRFFKVRLTRKQLISMINSRVSPYIRGLGFMYIRYTQPPADLWEWFEPYLDDEEEIDPRSGGGDVMTFGQVVRIMLTKLDWYGTLFPRIPVPIQKEIDEKFAERKRAMLFGDGRLDTRSRDREDDRSVRRRSRSRDRKRPCSSERRNEKKCPRPTRCGHHLRHHHCTKHRKRCPDRKKRANEANEHEVQKGNDADYDRNKESESRKVKDKDESFL